MQCMYVVALTGYMCAVYVCGGLDRLYVCSVCMWWP